MSALDPGKVEMRAHADPGTDLASSLYMTQTQGICRPGWVIAMYVDLLYPTSLSYPKDAVLRNPRGRLGRSRRWPSPQAGSRWAVYDIRSWYQGTGIKPYCNIYFFTYDLT